MLAHISRINVRYAETDQMGVVYHANYLPWFEVGRTELMKKYGVPYRELEKNGYYLPLVEAGLKYHRPAKYDDDIEIHSSIRKQPALKTRIDYEVKRNGELLVSGFTLHCFVDANGRPVRPPADFVEKMKSHFSA